MDIFVWEDRYAVGVTQIDEHHRHLVDLLNTTYHDFLNHVPVAELSGVFNELIDYATYHFSFEEQRMEESKYPQTASHKRQHEEFSRRVVEMYRDYQQRKMYFLEILGFLQNWLANHILQSDAELGRFLIGQNESAAKERNHVNA